MGLGQMIWDVGMLLWCGRCWLVVDLVLGYERRAATKMTQMTKAVQWVWKRADCCCLDVSCYYSLLEGQYYAYVAACDLKFCSQKVCFQLLNAFGECCFLKF